MRGRGAGIGAVNALVPRGTDGARQLPKRASSCGTELVERQVADREDGRIVGPDPALVEADQLVPGQRAHHRRIAGAGERLAVGMIGPVEQAGHRPRGDRAGLGHLLGDAGELLLAQPLHLAGAKAGLRIDVGEQIERRRRARASARSG